MKEFYASLLSHKTTPSEKVSMVLSANTVLAVISPLKPWSRLSAQGV